MDQVSQHFAAVFDDEVKHGTSTVGPSVKMESDTMGRGLDKLGGFGPGWGWAFGARVDHIWFIPRSNTNQMIAKK